MAHVINRKADFGNVRGLLMSNECTPKIDGIAFEGLLINLPEEVALRAPGPGTLAAAGVVLRLCGACRFKYSSFGLRGKFVNHILFIAVDARTHEPYARRMETVPNPVRRPDPDDGREPDMLVGEVFNPDLAELLRLPAREAEYIVYATLGPYRSNVLTTRVRVRRP